MENMFSIGQLAKYQRISKQTLIFYDKIGLFCPAYTDPRSGYRYYSAEQLDYLDSILIMKKIGFSLEEIKEHMKSYDTSAGLDFLRSQLDVLDSKIKELSLIKNRLEHRCRQTEAALSKKPDRPELGLQKACCLLCHKVEKPYSMREISIATKKCYAQALSEDLPVFFQCGVSVPLKHILLGRCTEASTAFLPIDATDAAGNIKKLPEGLCISAYHFGNYESISSSYEALLDFSYKNSLEIISDSYEFCINDYITSRNEDEFITKIIFYVKEKV